MNLFDLLLILALLLCAALAIRHIIRLKRAGKTTCGGNCSCCPHHCQSGISSPNP